MSYLCVHCHFHQPPRENPYLGLMSIEHSAYPFKNWNERIFRESYLPNLYAHFRMGSRLLKVVNNYQRVSFNFTYSLLSWLLREKPWFVERLKEAGRNALASGFNHTILPLDPEEDREVQIVWGIRAHEKVFGKKPRGFWLPELAVDKRTLSLLYRHGIRYIILAPHQVKTRGSFLRQKLPEGYMDIFVYNGELSHNIAFGDLISRVEDVKRRASQLKGITLIAVDGETFGHHKKFGEIGLAYLLETCSDVKTLEELYDLLHPEGDTQIEEFTSWSCSHGVERWRSNCGCSSGGMSGWHQKWREPLREALELLRYRVKDRLFDILGKYTHDEKRALFDFVEVLTGGSKEDFLQRNLKRPISSVKRRELFKRLFAYKYVSYAFSSDGWFFADISGIEAVKNMLFAKKAIDLIGDTDLEKTFLEILLQAPSNVKQYGDGFGVWKEMVLPQVVTKDNLATSVAVLFLSEVIPAQGNVGKYEYKIEGFEPSKVYLKNTETEEEYVKVESLLDFDVRLMPEALSNMLLENWTDNYLREELESSAERERLLESLLLQAPDRLFSGSVALRARVESYLKLMLFVLLKDGKPIDYISEVFDRADSYDINLRDENVKFWLESYLEKTVTPELEERQAIKLVQFVKDYNSKAGRMEAMVSLWWLQNWAWEKREVLKEDTLKLLDLS